MLVVEARKQWQIDLVFFLSVAVVGLAIWLAVSAVSGKREVWESDYFYNVGFPCMALVSGVAGFLRPNRPWLWGIATVALQPLALYWGHNPFHGGIGPIGLFFFAAYSVALAFCAVGGAALRHRN
ncbi:MAG: hypothetical protein ABJB49_05450 [Nitrospirota bacterium]